MDYEKAYKAVLKTATQWIKDGCTDKERICLESVFPELRESEDERALRIIKKRMCYDPVPISDEDRRIVENWLEKQKDFQFDYPGIYFYDGEKLHFQGNPAMEENPYDFAMSQQEKQKEPINPFDTKLFQDGVKEGRRLEREDIKKEQKPADDEAKAIAYREYERGRESGLRDGQKYVLDNAESYGLCKPAEWSEEDEKKRRNLMSLLANMRGDRITEETYQKYYPWLKDLRSRPKPSDNWKPSEEQMPDLTLSQKRAERII